MRKAFQIIVRVLGRNAILAWLLQSIEAGEASGNRCAGNGKGKEEDNFIR